VLLLMACDIWRAEGRRVAWLGLVSYSTRWSLNRYLMAHFLMFKSLLRSRIIFMGSDLT
jgi:hypothetical protein